MAAGERRDSRLRKLARGPRRGRGSRRSEPVRRDRQGGVAVLPRAEPEVEEQRGRCASPIRGTREEHDLDGSARPHGSPASAYQEEMLAEGMPQNEARRGGKRQYGTGSIFEKRNAWYDKWCVRDRQVMRKLGPIRKPGTREG